MDNSFFDSKIASEIKIFKINKLFYEFKTKSNEDIINLIVDNHRIKVKDKDNIGKKIPKIITDEITYYSYVYNELLQNSYWKTFLPSSISSSHNFEIKNISFVLFASINNNIFAIVGGGGIRVLKRYLNDRFGIEFFEYLANPLEDKVISLTVRGISGKLTEQRERYRNNQTLLDAIKFTDIPTKITLELRTSLKDSIFDFIEFKTDIIHIEVGSYFVLKYKMTFKDLHQVLISIDKILKELEPISLSSFIKEKNVDNIEKSYRNILCDNLRTDTMNHFSQWSNKKSNKLDIDFVHPSLSNLFYECNRFEIKAKKQKKPFYETSDRNSLYKEGLRYLYKTLGASTSKFEFDTVILGLRVYGYRDKELKTEAMFLQHITTEIQYRSKPIFLIDNNWYKVKDDFIETVNERCINMIKGNHLSHGILDIPWDRSLMDEGKYNLEYSDKENVYVFDKMLGQNIEFCDLMIEDSNNIYLVHVKDGFDAKIRDVSNQIVISANRYWNDINSGSTMFLESVVDSYNRNSIKKIDKKNFVNKFKAGKDSKEIIYVMAYNSNKYNMNLEEKIRKSKSNIAKYSLIQCVQDMTSRYTLKIIDIAEIKTGAYTKYIRVPRINQAIKG